MALNYSNTTDIVSHGSAAALDDLDPFTVLIWFRITSLATNRYFSKGGNTNLIGISDGDVRFQRARATTATDFRTSDTPVTENAWTFMAMSFDTTAGSGEVVNFYVGDLTSLAVESTYDVSTDGEGDLTTDAAAVLTFGNRGASSLAIVGDIGIVGLTNTVLSLNVCRSWQFRPRKLANMLIYSHYGFNGTDTQPDWSGNGNGGTVTTATVSDHVPLGPAFGFDLGWMGEPPSAAAGGGSSATPCGRLRGRPPLKRTTQGIGVGV